MKGPNGFEDRETFHIVNRDGPGAKVERSETETGLSILMHGFPMVVFRNYSKMGDTCHPAIASSGVSCGWNVKHG